MPRSYLTYRKFFTFIIAAIAPFVMPALSIAEAVFFRVLSVVASAGALVWLGFRELGRDAYRKIAELKPVYRDSYRTHGLSLVAPG